MRRARAVSDLLKEAATMTGEQPFVPVMPHRTFEDLQVGERRKSRERTISRQEILDFARTYDPQWFHTDAELARQSVFGEVVASGIHVLALWRQLDHEIRSEEHTSELQSLMRTSYA